MFKRVIQGDIFYERIERIEIYRIDPIINLQLNYSLIHA